MPHSPPKDGKGSAMVMDEYFEAEDARFVDELKKIDSLFKVAGLADRWKRIIVPGPGNRFSHTLHAPLIQSLINPLSSDCSSMPNSRKTMN